MVQNVNQLSPQDSTLGTKGIDSHQHFWKFDPVRDSWITDDMSVIQRDFLPQDLEPLLQRNNFAGCVLVQSDQSEEHNTFMLDLAEQNSFIKGVIGWVDLQADNILERLSYYKQYPILKGFRHVLQGETDRAFMLQTNFMRGVGLLKDFGYTYDILIYPDQLLYAKDFVAAFPDQKFVIDHLAKPAIKGNSIDEWKEQIMEFAQFENVYCKLSGMVTEADWKKWKKEDLAPYIDVVAETFGPGRIMFGSDWPVCLVAASYDEVVGVTKDYFASFTRDEQDAFFGGNATKFYNLK